MRAKPKRIFKAVLRKGGGAGGGVFVLIPYDVGQEYGKILNLLRQKRK